MSDGYDPVAHLPAGRLLTPEILDGLIAAYNANGRLPLSEQQIEAVAGAPLPVPATIKKPWPRGGDIGEGLRRW